MSRGSEGQGLLFGPADRPARVAAAEVPEGLRALARALPDGIHLGTSSWSFPGWRGTVYGGRYRKEHLARHGLRAYARHPLLRAVGIDRTYYAPLSASDYDRYAAAVPARFRFLVKAHEACTVARYPEMERYGARAGTKNERFLEPGFAAREVVSPYVEGLADRAGVLLFQFSPLDLGRVGGAAVFLDRLRAFLESLPAGPVYAVEIRNADLFGRRYLETLDAAGATHCFNVHPSMPSVAEQDRLRGDGGAGPLVIRWMLHSGLRYEQARRRYEPFDRLVDEDPAARSRIASLCGRAASAGRASFVIANNKAEGSAPWTLFRLAEEITGTRRTEEA